MFKTIVAIILWASEIIVFFSVVCFIEDINRIIQKRRYDQAITSGEKQFTFFTVPYWLAVILASAVCVIIGLFFPDVLRAVISVALIPYLKKHPA